MIVLRLSPVRAGLCSLKMPNTRSAHSSTLSLLYNDRLFASLKTDT